MYCLHVEMWMPKTHAQHATAIQAMLYLTLSKLPTFKTQKHHLLYLCSAQTHYHPQKKRILHIHQKQLLLYKRKI